MSRIAHPQQMLGTTSEDATVDLNSKGRFPDEAIRHCLQEDRGQHAVLVASGTT
jgi:hypothetical protein